MIVFDASMLVSATFRREAIPAQAVRDAIRADGVAVSEAVMADLLMLHSWRGVRILRPAEYLLEAEKGGP